MPRKSRRRPSRQDPTPARRPPTSTETSLRATEWIAIGPDMGCTGAPIPRRYDGTTDAKPVDPRSCTAVGPEGPRAQGSTHIRVGHDQLAEWFDTLADRWEAETRFLSNSAQMIAHPDHRAIVALGEAAVPLILRRLRDHGGHWHHALHELTGADPVRRHDWGRIEALRAAWLQWGRDHGYG